MNKPMPFLSSVPKNALVKVAALAILALIAFVLQKSNIHLTSILLAFGVVGLVIITATWIVELDIRRIDRRYSILVVDDLLSGQTERQVSALIRRSTDHLRRMDEVLTRAHNIPKSSSKRGAVIADATRLRADIKHDLAEGQELLKSAAILRRNIAQLQQERAVTLAELDRLHRQASTVYRLQKSVEEKLSEVGKVERDFSAN